MTTTDGFGRLLVVSAHAADFVWRAAGYIAVVTSAFGEAHVVCLSYGEHGESPGAWKQPGMTLDRVKEIRRAEAEEAGRVLGATMHFLDQGDYPLPDTRDLVLRLADLMRELQPGVILTHSRADPYNYDHPQAADLTLRARMVAQAQGRPSAHPVLGAPPVFRFEPHQPEMCEFRPDVLVDITPGVRPEAAGHGRDGIPGAPGPLLRGPGRAARGPGAAQRRGGRDPLRRGLPAGLPPGERGAGVKPVVIVDPPRADPGVVDELGELGVATVHEAAGKTGPARHRPPAGLARRPGRRDRAHRAVRAG